MKITSKSVRGFLIILLVSQAINASLFLALDFTQKSLGNYIYQSMTAPFLDQSPHIALNTKH